MSGNSFYDCDFQQVQSVCYTLDYSEPSDTLKNSDHKFANICNNWNMHGNLITFLPNLGYILRNSGLTSSVQLCTFPLFLPKMGKMLSTFF